MMFCPHPVDRSPMSHLRCAENLIGGFWKIIDVLSLHLTESNQSLFEEPDKLDLSGRLAKMICSISVFCITEAPPLPQHFEFHVKWKLQMRNCSKRIVRSAQRFFHMSVSWHYI